MVVAWGIRATIRRAAVSASTIARRGLVAAATMTNVPSIASSIARVAGSLSMLMTAGRAANRGGLEWPAAGARSDMLRLLCVLASTERLSLGRGGWAFVRN